MLGLTITVSTQDNIYEILRLDVVKIDLVDNQFGSAWRIATQ